MSAKPDSILLQIAIMKNRAPLLHSQRLASKINRRQFGMPRFHFVICLAETSRETLIDNSKSKDLDPPKTWNYVDHLKKSTHYNLVIRTHANLVRHI